MTDHGSSPATEVLDFLNSIEGAGYGGMASFEIARQHARDMAFLQPAIPTGGEALRASAERVCWFDWSGNDMDAVAAIDALREVVTAAPSSSSAGIDSPLAVLIKQYARDLRRNASGGDDYPFNLMRGVADYLEILIKRAKGNCTCAQAGFPDSCDNCDGLVSAGSESAPVTVTIYASGDNENTPAEAVHHALAYAHKAGLIEGWSDPIPNVAQGWRDMGTAPKDGHEILVVTQGLVRVGFWDEARGGQWSKWPGREHIIPTCWQPPPPPPITSSEGK